MLQTTTSNILTKIIQENAGIHILASGLTVLGHVFTPGELPGNASLTATINGVPVTVQVDVKTSYADGSAKMVVLTMERPALNAGAHAEVVLTTAEHTAAGSLDVLGSLATHDFAVLRTDAQGHTAQIDVVAALKAAIISGEASYWQMGPLAVQARVEIPLEGSARMIFDVILFKGGGMNVEVQINNDGAMGAVGGRVAHTLAFVLDGQPQAQVSLDQGQYQNWHESFSSTGRDGGQGLGSPAGGWLNVRQDIAGLQDTGAVARYDLTHGVDGAILDDMAAAAAAPGWDAPLATHGVTQYMPGTGGRADIGITTEANTTWLISQDARAATFALGQAEAASAIPWHLWDAASDTWLGTDAYPRLWTDPRGGSGVPGDAQSGSLSQQWDGATGWSLDSAHQPDLSYVPFLLTGQRWMLDNLQAQASWNIMSQWPAIREGATDLLVQDNQVRGAAWSLRQIDEAAWASPDGSVEKAAFTEASAANWAWLVAQLPLWTEQQGEAHGWLPGAYGAPGALPPWQQDYFASTAIAAASRGNADALTFLEWQSNFLIGRFTHAAEGFDPHDGAAYLIAIADPTTGTPFRTWSEIGAKTDAWGWSNNDGWSHSQGDYAQLALATLAGIAHLTGSVAAAQAYHALLADAPPFTSTAAFQHDPTFAIAAPGITGAPIGSSVAQLSVVLGADSWQGDPEAVILLDGTEVFRGTIGASHGSGGIAINLGEVQTGVAHNLTVRFLNDAWGGTAAADRNLYVEDIRLDGVSTGQHADMVMAGDVTFALRASSSQPPAYSDGDDIVTGGAGNASLTGGLGVDRFAVMQGTHAITDLGLGADTVVVSRGATANATLSADWTATAASGNEGTIHLVSAGFDANVSSATGSQGWGISNAGHAASVILTGSSNADQLTGGNGSDTLDGRAGSDELSGNAGNDLLIGGAGQDTMTGGAGADRFQVDSGTDTVLDLGFGGTDVLIVSALATVQATLGAAWTASAATSNAGIAQLAASGFNVNLTAATGTQGWEVSNAGQANAVTLAGSGWDDHLTGGDANDSLVGNRGNDRLIGGAGADRLDGGLGTDRLEGGAGDDTFVVDHAGDVVVEGIGGGYDRVVASLSWTLGTELERLSLCGTANLNGTGNGLANRLDGNAGANLLDGGEGNDALYGGAGQDTLVGGAGADSLDGGLDSDRLQGGAGNDIYWVNDRSDVVVETTGGGYDRVVAALNWTLGVELEQLSLSGTADLNGTGNILANRLDGNGGANLLDGREGDDLLYGCAGNDSLLGGAGADLLDGGAGTDRLTGGLGADRFCFRSAVEANGDVITDFHATQADKIDLRAIDANVALEGNEAFAWIGGSGFSGVAGQLRFAGGALQGDLDGNGLGDFTIQVDGVASLLATSVWL